MAARLEAATKQFGSTLLLSGDFFNLLSTKAQKYCRQIDMVTVKGSINPMALYTYDVTNYEPLPEPNTIKITHHRAHTMGPNPQPRPKFSSTIFDTDSDIRGLQKDMPEEFFPIFQRAFDAYIAGGTLISFKSATCASITIVTSQIGKLLTNISRRVSR
jgi:hypothetical protein